MQPPAVLFANFQHPYANYDKVQSRKNIGFAAREAKNGRKRVWEANTYIKTRVVPRVEDGRQRHVFGTGNGQSERVLRSRAESGWNDQQIFVALHDYPLGHCKCVNAAKTSLERASLARKELGSRHDVGNVEI